MTCLKNDFVHHGRPLMYEVLHRDFSTFPICTTFFLYTSLHKQWKYHWTTYIINAIYQGRNYMAKGVLILSCISNLVRNNFYQRYKKKMFSFYAIWFGLYRIYTLGVSYLFLMVVLHLRYMNVVFTSPLLGPRLLKALSNGVLRVSRSFCEQILCFLLSPHSKLWGTPTLGTCWNWERAAFSWHRHCSISHWKATTQRISLLLLELFISLCIATGKSGPWPGLLLEIIW